MCKIIKGGSISEADISDFLRRPQIFDEITQFIWIQIKGKILSDFAAFWKNLNFKMIEISSPTCIVWTKK